MSTSTADAEDVGASAPVARRKARMSRFVRILLAATVAVHVPVVLGVAEFAARAGASRPLLWGWAWGALGVVLFIGRVRAGMPDRPRNPVTTRLFDIPYFIHWCAAVYSFFPAILATVLAPFADLVRGVPVRVPM